MPMQRWFYCNVTFRETFTAPTVTDLGCGDRCRGHGAAVTVLWTRRSDLGSCWNTECKVHVKQMVLKLRQDWQSWMIPPQVHTARNNWGTWGELNSRLQWKLQKSLDFKVIHSDHIYKMLCLGIKTKQAFVIQTQLGVFSLVKFLKTNAVIYCQIWDH